jgi:hypothetical protein
MIEDIKLENIGPKESFRRMIFGIFMLILTIGILLIMMAADITVWWRLPLFIPYTMAALGIVQSRQRTCVALASQGACNFDQGDEPIEDDELKAALKAKSRKINLQSMMIGVILTVLSLTLPA